ncbi:MAG: hypothetical protein SFX74_06680 [Fimbriimonadaceae bacterium]|nr:hypothetical protein [Fimbriimonadaceae bacterium]
MPIPLVPPQILAPERPATSSKVFCPICVANGYASAPSSTKKWFFTGNSVGSALWYLGEPRWQFGATYHSATQGVRALVGYQAITERHGAPALNLSYGLQSQETGATGVSVTLEKNGGYGPGRWNVFAGASVRSRESVVRPVAGFRYSPSMRWSFGNQYDGNVHNPFVQYRWREYSVGALAVGARVLTLTFGISF